MALNVPGACEFYDAHGFHHSACCPIGRKEVITTLPEENQVKPFTGWKRINLAYRRPYWEIGSSHHPITDEDGFQEAIQPVSVAQCQYRQSETHIPPVPGCECGFYGWNTHKRLSESGHIARVSFYGRVIVCEYGYRAEKQRIDEIWVDHVNPNDPVELLREQFPGIIWHLPEPLPRDNGAAEIIAANMTAKIPTATNVAVPFYVPGIYDVLPAEIVDGLQSGQIWVHGLPIMKNASVQLTARYTTTNQGISIEFMGGMNERLFTMYLTGSKYWYQKGH